LPSVAAPVDDLIRTINQLVVADTNCRSMASGNELPGVTRTDRSTLTPLAENLDIPQRLAPSPAAVVNRGSGTAYDQRPAIRAALTEVVASCANTLEAQGPLPEAADPSDRSRLGIAVSRAYAASATPRLVARLSPNGRADDLGLFTEPVLEGDTAAARALAVAIGARTRQRHEEVLKTLVGAGRGAAAPTAARMLLDTKPRFATLPDPEQAVVVQTVAQQLETTFADRDQGRAAARELTEELENRREDVTGGAGAIDVASRLATEQVLELHEFFDRLPESHPANQARAEKVAAGQIERPESVDDLVRRVERTVGELTGTRQSMWNTRIEPQTGQSPDRTLRLTEQQALALRELTENGTEGPLAAEDVAAAREGILVATSSHVRWAVPDSYSLRAEAAAQSVAPRFTAIEQAVSTAFAEDHFNEVVDRNLPGGLAEQVRLPEGLRLPEGPRLDERFAPAARGLATAIDAATDGPAGETLRRMAGEGRAHLAMAAAEVVVADSGIEPTERPFAVRMIADEIDKKFDELPAQLEAWDAGEQTAMGDRDVADPQAYGQQVGRLAQTMAEVYADDPGLAKRDSLAADRAAAQDHGMRFANDPAAPTPGTVRAPAAVPKANRAGEVVESKRRGLEGRG